MATTMVQAIPKLANGVNRPKISAIPPPNSESAANACSNPGGAFGADPASETHSGSSASHGE